MSPATSLWFFLTGSVLLALLLSLIPLPFFLTPFRPELVCIIALYWVFALPHRFGVVFGFSVGLIQSVVESAVWGGYSLALSLVIYLSLKSLPRLKNYSLVHQSLWVSLWVFLHQLIVSWVLGLAGYEVSFTHQLVSALTSAMCWPFLVKALNWLRYRYHVE